MVTEGQVKSRNELTITRTFEAPRKLVWKAWTEPERMMRWWGPKGFTTPVSRIDLRVGGESLSVMRSPEGRDFWGKGVYREIVEPERLVMTDSFADEKGNTVPASYYGMSGDWPLELLITVTFEEDDGNTRLTLKHSGVGGISDTDFAGMQQGWNESFDKLAEYLKTAIRQKITPHLWFDKEAKEAADFYTSAFKGSRVKSTMTLHNTPSGSVDVVSFDLMGLEFQAISAGPLFRFNPSVSFIVNFDPSREKDAREDLDSVWRTLSQGGTALMPLQEYPFSKRYGWIQDKYRLSWQLILTDPKGEERPPIIPSLLFVGDVCGKAEEAIKLYLSVFRDSKLGEIHRYGPAQEPDREGTVMFADFMLEGRWFAAMDSAHEHKFSFNEAISFVVHCDTQEEIDYYWGKLSADPKAEQCGWIKDRYGLSWQIVPDVMDEMLRDKDEKKVARVTEAFLKMKKLDISGLKEAYEER